MKTYVLIITMIITAMLSTPALAQNWQADEAPPLIKPDSYRWHWDQAQAERNNAPQSNVWVQDAYPGVPLTPITPMSPSDPGIITDSDGNTYLIVPKD